MPLRTLRLNIEYIADHVRVHVRLSEVELPLRVEVACVRRYRGPRIRWARLCGVLVFAGHLACSDARRSTNVTVSGDTTVVSNTQAGVWQGRSQWSVDLDLRLAPPPGSDHALGNVIALAVSDSGDVYALDQVSQTVVTFAPDGRPRAVIGRRGDGPGEFRDAIGLAWSPAGELWVVDAGTQRYTVFDRHGTLLRTLPRQSDGYVLPWPGGFDRSGVLHDVSFVRSQRDGGVQHLVTRAKAGRLDSVPLPRHEPMMFEVPGRPGMHGWVPFTSRLVWRIDLGGGVWHAVTDRYRLHRLSPDSGKIMIIERGAAERRVTEAERESVLEQLRAIGVSMSPDRIPKTKPLIESLSVDDQGYAWVYAATEPSARTTSFDVFSPAGRYLGPVVVSERLQGSPAPLVMGNRLGCREATPVHSWRA